MTGKHFSRDSEFWPYFFLLVLAAALYLPVILSGETSLIPSYQDRTQWQLYREFIAQSLKAGYFPLWCEQLFSGLDFAGWGHASAFYPLAFAFFLLKFTQAATLNQFVHLTILLWGFYFLGRRVGLSRSSAGVAAAGFGFAFFLPSMLEDFLPAIFYFTLVPWVYAFSLELIQKFKARAFFLLSLLVGLQLLSGHLEMAVLGHLSLFVFLLAFLAVKRAAPKDMLRAGLLWFLSLGLGIELGMLVFFPGFAGYSQSFRKLGLSYELFTFFPSTTIPLETIPFALLYLSPVFLLVLIAAGKNRKPVFWASLIMLVFTLIQTFNWLDFLWIFYHVPVLNRFIPHGRAFAHAGVAWFLILGLGLERLGAPGNKHLSRLWIPVLFLEAAFFSVIAVMAKRYGGTITWEYLEATQAAGLSRLVLAPVMALIALGGLALVLKSRDGRTGISILIKPALLLEFVLTGFFILPRHSAGIMDPHPEYRDFLSRIHPADYRIQAVYSFRDWERLTSPLQTGVLGGTRSADAYITFSTLRYTEFLKALDDKAFAVRNGKVSDIETLNILKRGDFVSPEKLPLMNLLNLKYMVGQNKNLKDCLRQITGLFASLLEDADVLGIVQHAFLELRPAYGLALDTAALEKAVLEHLSGVLIPPLGNRPIGAVIRYPDADSIPLYPGFH